MKNLFKSNIISLIVISLFSIILIISLNLMKVNKSVATYSTVATENMIYAIIFGEETDVAMSPECILKTQEINSYLSYFKPSILDSDTYTKIVENNNKGVIILYDSNTEVVKVIFEYDYKDNTLLDINYKYVDTNMFTWDFTPTEETFEQERG